MQRYETVFRSTVCKAEHPVVQVHPLTAVWAIILGSFVRRLLGVTSEASARLFAMLQDHVTRLENIVRWRWSAGDVVIWDNRAIQHKAIDDYGNEPRIERRVTIDGRCRSASMAGMAKRATAMGPIETAPAAA